jgi:hypothetical protein
MMASSFVSLPARSRRLVALGELFDGFLALLYESLQDLNRFGLVERADFFDFLELDGGLDAAQDAEAELVLGAHGVGQILLNSFGKTHGIPRWLNIAEEDLLEENGKN